MLTMEYIKAVRSAYAGGLISPRPIFLPCWATAPVFRPL